MLRYHHRQFGTVVFAIGGTVILLIIALLIFVDNHPVGVGGLILLIILFVLFLTLTVEVTDRDILMYFGPGLIRKRFSLDSIKGARSARNKWYYGWGIRRAPGCWLYNVSGLDSVEIELKNGRKYRIGTDQPEELLKEIEQACEISS